MWMEIKLNLCNSNYLNPCMQLWQVHAKALLKISPENFLAWKVRKSVKLAFWCRWGSPKQWFPASRKVECKSRKGFWRIRIARLRAGAQYARHVGTLGKAKRTTPGSHQDLQRPLEATLATVSWDSKVKPSEFPFPPSTNIGSQMGGFLRLSTGQ